ncbi:hypothetical protein FRAHR75_820014 [Frankia sp. Hr75.2]|nr:hypothetical protein FRAHR75_820014 [Frankia sp. Hr75.2]
MAVALIPRYLRVLRRRQRAWREVRIGRPALTQGRHDPMSPTRPARPAAADIPTSHIDARARPVQLFDAPLGFVPGPWPASTHVR